MAAGRPAVAPGLDSIAEDLMEGLVDCWDLEHLGRVRERVDSFHRRINDRLNAREREMLARIQQTIRAQSLDVEGRKEEALAALRRVRTRRPAVRIGNVEQLLLGEIKEAR